jgi:catechol 2,3-dioxygenase-like lactoylglutathione lyase family enzyme
MIKGLHHNAYRCRDSEQTREFYEDFLGLPLQLAFDIKQTITGRVSKVLHSFYQMADGSFLAFFEEPDAPLTSSSNVTSICISPWKWSTISYWR